MQIKQALLARLDAIARSLEASGHAEALIGLGSVGRKIDGLPAGRGAHQPVRRAVPLPALRGALPAPGAIAARHAGGIRAHARIRELARG